MDARHRERLLRMRTEDQLPQQLILMVERAEYEMKQLGGGSLTLEALVILSAVVPRLEALAQEASDAFDEALDRGSNVLTELKDKAIDSHRRGECGEMVTMHLAVGDKVDVHSNGDVLKGEVVGSFGSKVKVKIDGDSGKYRIFEEKHIEALLYEAI